MITEWSWNPIVAIGEIMSNFFFCYNVFQSHLFQMCQNASLSGKVLTLYRIQTLSDASAADDIWKHCVKRRNRSKQAISPFAIMFSIFLPRCFQSCLLQICCMWERVKAFSRSMSIIIAWVRMFFKLNRNMMWIFKAGRAHWRVAWFHLGILSKWT